MINPHNGYSQSYNSESYKNKPRLVEAAPKDTPVMTWHGSEIYNFTRYEQTSQPKDLAYSLGQHRAHEVPLLPEVDQAFLIPPWRNGRAENNSSFAHEKLYRLVDLVREAEGKLGSLEKYWSDEHPTARAVFKRTLWVVDNLIVKERETGQRGERAREMGWDE
ncbi:hypothetical protein BDZ91DRAFT_762492 [Kalaharituber pfeilii]|nr:hypothetical protein BDZ91DRAFT_762492 [Kalaharituber pfeilii]